MNKFQDILAFTRVAELGGFAAAARAIGTSPSAITKSIAQLEDDLQTSLLQRTTRRLCLTEHGTQFYENCRQILAEMENAENAIREVSQQPRGKVRLSMPPSFGRQTFIPALPEFYRRFPGIQLELFLKTQTSNPLEGGFDLAVHSGRLVNSGLLSRVLVRGPQKTVASPTYLSQFDTPTSPEDLSSHNCIVGRFGRDWMFCDSNGKNYAIRVNGSLSTDSGDALREAAVAGVGITQATWWLFRDDLASRALTPLLETFEVEADPISIVFPPARHVSLKIRALTTFLTEITR